MKCADLGGGGGLPCKNNATDGNDLGGAVKSRATEKMRTEIDATTSLTAGN